MGVADNPAPSQPYEAKFSIQYCVACALARGRVGLEDFSSSAITDQPVREVMSNTTLGIASDLEARYPELWSARVMVFLRDGRMLSSEVEHPKGDPENPLSLDELHQKFAQLLLGTQYQAFVPELIARVNRLDQLHKASELLAGL
jgi:2-methylcitrate dehydratase PrpD